MACTPSTSKIFGRGVFEVKNSTVISTQVYAQNNCINGSYRAVKIYKQQITWGDENDTMIPFSLSSLNVYCDCKFFDKETNHNGKCCRHIINNYAGQFSTPPLCNSYVSHYYSSEMFFNNLTVYLSI